jgi:MerR family transcriptional regulator, light-induced transcriptional regulator
VTAPDRTPMYRIGALARLTGLSTHVLRAWERRYGVVEPSRSPGGNRFYSEADVVRLRRVKSLVDRGHAVSAVAGLSNRRLASMVAEQEVGDGEGFDEEAQRRFFAAIEALDVAAAERLLAHLAVALAPEKLPEVLGRLLDAIGARWEQGLFGVAHEHAASALLRNLIGRLLQIHEHPAAPAALVTTPPGELHEFGALLAALVASGAGWRVVYLGPNLPVDEIVSATSRSGAAAVLLSVVNEPTAPTREALAELSGALPRHVRLLLGGRSATRCRAATRRAVVCERLADLGPLLALD